MPGQCRPPRSAAPPLTREMVVVAAILSTPSAGSAALSRQLQGARGAASSRERSEASGGRRSRESSEERRDGGRGWRRGRVPSRPRASPPPLASCRVPGPAGRPWRTRGAPAPWCLRQRDWRCSGHRAEAPGAEPRPSPGGPRCPEPPAVGAPCRDPSPALPRSALLPWFPALPCGLKYTGKAGSRAGGAVTAVLQRKACSKGQACC